MAVAQMGRMALVPSFMSAPMPLAGFYFLSGPADSIRLDAWVADVLGLPERNIPASSAISYATKLDKLADVYDTDKPAYTKYALIIGLLASGVGAPAAAAMLLSGNRKQNTAKLREAAAKLRAVAPSRVGTGGQSRPTAQRDADAVVAAPAPIDTTLDQIDGGGGVGAGSAVAALVALAALGGGGYYLWSRRSGVKSNPRRKRNRSR